MQISQKGLLEFENHDFLENQVFLPTEQVGTSICRMIYELINFKICLSLFGWKENILPKQHIVKWRFSTGEDEIIRQTEHQKYYK